ncbi:MAG: fatty acid desaturase [Verrucomicrobiota bacterium]|nr:fatty acid desaturase [Verrucomicrobiota bacterium]
MSVIEPPLPGVCSTRKKTASWRKIVAKYQIPSLKKSVWQIINSMGPFVAIWILLYFTVEKSWPLTLSLAALAGLFLVRVFIIFHDCGNGSFFRSKAANQTIGFIAGLMTLTPFRHWRWQHAVHHSSSGNLDERGVGDIWTMTVKEYKAAGFWLRLQYRLARNPLILFVITPLGLFLVYQRFAYKFAKRRDRYDVYIMNACIIVYFAAMISIFGFWNFTFIQLTMTGVSSAAGVWLFYVQHQFEDTYWRSGEEWDYTDSAIKDSSFYRLPALLNWFSGNIGYHHIHHLSSRIPNYNLRACHESEPFFQQVPELTLRTSLRSIKLRLWDEEKGKLVGY